LAAFIVQGWNERHLGPGDRGSSEMARPVAYPVGCWPLEMRAETAAAYCDEPSIEAFLSKVAKGIYSQPVRQSGCLPKWHRVKLERDIARRHNLQETTGVEDVTGLI
jgi:hypothetical protein